MTPSDLNISQDELDQITSALANDANADPIGDSVAQALQTVTDYTRRFVLTQDRIKRLAKPIVIFDLYTKLNRVSDAQRAAVKDAMGELEQIRDGKFVDLALASPLPTNTPGSAAKFGSNTKVQFR